MSLLQKYRKEETRKTTPDEEKNLAPTIEAHEEKEPIAPKVITKSVKKKEVQKILGTRSRPVISATVSNDLVEALNTLTEEKYLNRSKFIEDALVRTIKTEFPDVAKRYQL
ncbi:MAG: hypothetical protein ACFFDW_09365 [Candidatus Thorarchaeota archaeon]